MSQPQGGHPGEPAGRGGAPDGAYPPGYPPPYPPGHGQSGYQGYGDYQGYPGYRSYPLRRPSLLSRLQPAAAASIAVFVCALVCYFAGYAHGGARFYIAIYVLLAGGLLCAIHALPIWKSRVQAAGKEPSSPNTITAGAVLSVVGGLGVLFEVIHLPAVPVSAVLILIFALLQLLVAVAAFLLDSGLLVLPPPREAGRPPPPSTPPSGAGPPSSQWEGSPRSGPAGDTAGAQMTRPSMAWPSSEALGAPDVSEHPDRGRGSGTAEPEHGHAESGRRAGPTAYLPTTPESPPHGYGTAAGPPPRQP